MKHFILLFVVFSLFIVNRINAQWTQVPDFEGGDIVALEYCGDNIFAGTYSTGVYFFSRNANRWVHVTNGLANLLTHDMISNGAVIFAATSGGLFSSTNNGTNWVREGLNYKSVSCLAKSGSNLFAGVFGDGIYLSANNGKTWVAVNNGLTNRSIACISVIDSKILAGTYEGGGFISTDNGTNWKPTTNGLENTTVRCFKALGNKWFAGTEKGIFLSTDNGVKWTSVGLSGELVRSLETVGNYIYALSRDCNLYISADSGKVWSPIVNNFPKSFIWTLEAFGNNLYLGTKGGGVVFTTDFGNSWNELNNSLLNITANDFASYDAKLFAATDKGVYSSADSGMTWRTAGLRDWDVKCLAVSGKNLFAGINNNGVYISTDYGDNWTLARSGLQCYVTSLTVSGKTVFAGTGGVISTGVYKTTNNGSNWIQTSLNDKDVRSLAANGNYVFAGTVSSGIFMSSDDGTNWKPAGLSNCYIPCLIVRDGIIYAGTNKGIYYSTDNGTNWYSFGMSNYTIRTIAFSGKNIYVGTSKGVFHSTNNGLTWTAENAGMSNMTIYALAVNGQNVFAGTVGYGVWKQAVTPVPPYSANIEPSNYEVTATEGILIPINIQIGKIQPIILPDDLYGISFNLNWDHPELLEYSSGEAGTFLGDNPLCLIQKYNDHIEVGLSRTSGVSTGSGIALSCTLKVRKTPLASTKIKLSLSNIIATQSNSSLLELASAGDTTIILIKLISVWPGDANNDGVVDASDALPIGLHYNKTGPARSNKSYSWEENKVLPWNILGNTVFADCDGSGIVNSSDIMAVGLNYGKTHSMSDSLFLKQTSVKKELINYGQELSLRLISPNNNVVNYDELKPSEEFYLSVVINKFRKILGISFDIEWSNGNNTENIIKEWENNGLKISSVWGKNPLRFSKISDGKLSVAITKTDHLGLNEADIEILRIKMVKGKQQNLKFELKQIRAIDEAGNNLDIKGLPLQKELTNDAFHISKDYQITNYPNPFNPQTKLVISIPEESRVTIIIYNSIGKEITRLLNNENLLSGVYEYTWDGAGEPSGIYICRLQVNNSNIVKKLTLIK